MASRPHAHLMLPSPLGLLEYDVLEDGVFLGPRAKGGLEARPTPFKGAVVALTRTGPSFVARPLPGENAPLINGESTEEKALEDGDRIGIGDQVALFRTRRGLVEPVEPPKAEEPPEPKPAAPRRAAPPRKNHAVTVIALVGLALLLAATYRAVNHLKAIQSAEMSKTELPDMPKPKPGIASRASKELAELFTLEARDPDNHEDLIVRYRRFADAFEGEPEAEAAQARVRELMEGWAKKSRAKLDEDVERLVGAHQFARALKELRDFEKRFATTAAAEGTQTMRRDVRAKARKQLDALIAKAGPLIMPQPRAAHRMLMGVTHEFPADMSAEVVTLIQRAVARMIEMPPKKQGARPLAPPSNGGDPGLPPLGGGDKPPTNPPGRGPDKKEEQKENDQARDAWKAAHADLQAGNYPEALQGYTMLIQQHGNSSLYRANKAKIAAGRRAAKVGALGPIGMLGVPATMKKGRLECEYSFDDRRIYEEDWREEQPFSSEMPVQMSWKRGSILMEKCSGLFHKLVYLPDVRIEAEITVQIPHDFGMIAVEESNSFRAILFNIANTKFTLKKGAAAKVNPGHLLWYIGEGVWKDADEGFHGYIKIAEKSRSKLQGGDRLKVELQRRKDSAEGSFQGKTDGVHLEGKVKGDDGSTMGPGRVGIFTNSGVISVDSIRISGKVDMEWFRKQLEFMVASDPGPDPD